MCGINLMVLIILTGNGVRNDDECMVMMIATTLLPYSEYLYNECLYNEHLIVEIITIGLIYR